jgi:hypothetical protein
MINKFNEERRRSMNAAPTRPRTLNLYLNGQTRYKTYKWRRTSIKQRYKPIENNQSIRMSIISLFIIYLSEDWRKGPTNCDRKSMNTIATTRLFPSFFGYGYRIDNNLGRLIGIHSKGIRVNKINIFTFAFRLEIVPVVTRYNILHKGI